jgi:hypothetical protein
MIPIAGGAAAELFQMIVQPPMEKRRTEWMQAVGERLHEHGEKGLDLEGLKSNERFVSAVMHATQAAIRTHVAAKRDALRNAILNVAVGQAPDETVQHLLLSLIDDLTEMHLRILQVFHQPPALPSIGMGGLSTILERAIPDLRNRREIYDQLWKDLYSRGLVNTEGLHGMMSGNGLASRRTTGLGETLLKFVSEPKAT